MSTHNLIPLLHAAGIIALILGSLIAAGALLILLLAFVMTWLGRFNRWRDRHGF